MTRSDREGKSGADTEGWILRPATRADGPAVIELIDGIYREYGDRVRLDGAEADLRDVERYFPDRGGAFVVLELDGRIVGTHAVDPQTDDPSVCTFRRLYVHPDLRGAGAGQFLMDWAINWARQRPFETVEFWSDVRFTRAHRFFRRFGFECDGRVREMQDGHAPYREFFFQLKLR